MGAGTDFSFAVLTAAIILASYFPQARNKKCISVDLKKEEGRDVVRKLLNSADICIENFSPGVLERWALCPESTKESNPGLIYARISGYGQDGPYSSRYDSYIVWAQCCCTTFVISNGDLCLVTKLRRVSK